MCSEYLLVSDSKFLFYCDETAIQGCLLKFSINLDNVHFVKSKCHEHDIAIHRTADYGSTR